MSLTPQNGDKFHVRVCDIEGVRLLLVCFPPNASAAAMLEMLDSEHQPDLDYWWTGVEHRGALSIGLRQIFGSCRECVCCSTAIACPVVTEPEELS